MKPVAGTTIFRARGRLAIIAIAVALVTVNLVASPASVSAQVDAPVLLQRSGSDAAWFVDDGYRHYVAPSCLESLSAETSILPSVVPAWSSIRDASSNGRAAVERGCDAVRTALTPTPSAPGDASPDESSAALLQLAGSDDAWFIADGYRHWVSPTCLTQLQTSITPTQVDGWRDIQDAATNGRAASDLPCDTMASALGTTPTTCLLYTSPSPRDS